MKIESYPKFYKDYLAKKQFERNKYGISNI